jgi:glutathione S-transferase
MLLHTMPNIGWGLLAPSPFCVKAEVGLRLAGVAYRAMPTLTADKAPRGKLPWAEDGGVVIADSERILEHVAATRGDPLDEAGASAGDRAQAHLVRRTVEESLYFAIVDERWRDPDLRAAYTADLLAGLPRAARPLVRAWATRLLTGQLRAQGMGRRPRDEVTAVGAADLAAVAAALGERPYFTGERPRGVDAAVFGQLANLWYVPVETPLRAALAGHPNLVAFVERVAAKVAA